MTEFNVISKGQFEQFTKRLKSASDGKQIRQAMSKAFRAEVKPAVDNVKSAVMAIKVTGSRGGGSKRRAEIYKQRHPKGRVKQHGLRASIARGIRSRIKFSGRDVGAFIYIDKSVIPYSQRKLPYYLDGRGRWRHPLFGNRDKWYGQQGQEFFANTLSGHNSRIGAALTKEVNKVVKEL